MNSRGIISSNMSNIDQNVRIASAHIRYIQSWMCWEPCRETQDQHRCGSGPQLRDMSTSPRNQGWTLVDLMPGYQQAPASGCLNIGERDRVIMNF
jgi:hypothetical protein